ncbi:MAG: arginine--tRNA ligase [Candidatus Rokubacteria bacterium]|nr:arginine--tRNA ligase [Candidatus Rokubacteria bacterium]
MAQTITQQLTDGVQTALAKAGLPPAAVCPWEVPRQAEHGDYATNVPMTLARAARRPPRQIAEAIVANFPALGEVDHVEIAGPGFLNVFLSPAWCAEAVRRIIAAGDGWGRGDAAAGQRVRLEFVSANPTGPLVIVNARAAAVGDSLVRMLCAQGAHVTTEYYVNDAGNQFDALARSVDARIREALGLPSTFPENGYPGEYVMDLAGEYLAEHRIDTPAALEAHRAQKGLGAGDWLEHLGRYAVAKMVESQRRVLADYGVTFDVWTSEQRDVRAVGLPDAVIEELERRGLVYELDGALWFRATAFGDEKDRVLRKSTGELTYFAVDLAFHHVVKFGAAERVINLMGPDHHGYVPRMRAAMQALDHAPEALEVMIIQLVTLLREGQPVRMSKRRGEFVLMEELIEEVGRDAARFTFLTRRHDSPLEFDLAVATRQTAENPVYYVQYAHARIRSIWKQVAEQGIAVPAWDEVDLGVLTLPEEQALIKRLLQYPDFVAGAARALEPHRVAYWLTELAGVFHPYYRAHRVIQDDRRLMLARLALCTAVGLVVRNGLGLLGVSAPESM